MLLFSFLLSCAQPEAPLSDSKESVCSEAHELSYVLNHIEYARRHEGVAWGFNIDGLESDDQDDDGCNKADLVDPLGNTGIDNGLSSLIPALDMTEASAVEGSHLGQSAAVRVAEVRASSPMASELLADAAYL